MINVTAGQQLIINGPLNLDPNSVIQVEFPDGHTQSPIVVNGPAALDGIVILVLHSTLQDGQSIPLLNATSITGAIDTIIVKQPNKCKRTEAKGSYSATTFSAIISVKNTCGLSALKIAAIVVGSVIGLAIIVGFALLFLHCRKPLHSLFDYHSLDDEAVR